VSQPDAASPETQGTLFVVSTPIGNLGDLTFRAVETLWNVDAVLCEDTRHSRKLLVHYEIDVPVEPLHEHNEAAATPGLLRRLAQGARLALISDAGTPLISDPGNRLVAAAIAAGIPVVPIPGASAVLAALAASGMAGGPFTFLGFLERKGPDRQTQLSLLSRLRHPSVVYESANRLVDTLSDVMEAGCGGRLAVVARELTKQFEEFKRGTVAELAEYYRTTPPRGEVVLIVEGNVVADPAADAAEVHSAVRQMQAEGLGSRDIVRTLIERFGLPRNEAYRLAHEGA
jgi:16S rRNA (cytidine1402-2'-O)-methyltransferase